MDKELITIVTGTLCLTIFGVVALLVVPENTTLLYSIIGGILAVLGVPPAVRGIRSVINRRSQ